MNSGATLLGYNPFLVAFWKATFWGFPSKGQRRMTWGGGTPQGGPTQGLAGWHGRGSSMELPSPLLVAFGGKYLHTLMWHFGGKDLEPLFSPPSLYPLLPYK